MAKKINEKIAYFCAFSNYTIKKNNYKYPAALLLIIIGLLFLPKIAYMTSVDSETLIELTNNEREKEGLNKLTANQLLAKAAHEKADAIINNQTFQHNIKDKKFSSWIRDAGYQYSYVGENLAMDFSSCEGIMKAWSESELHKKNILNPRFTEIGMAVIDGEFNGEMTTIVVQIFGEPLSEKTGKVSGIDLAHLFYQENFMNSSSPYRMVLPVNESFNKRNEILLLSILNGIDISTSTNLNNLLSIINRNETISTDKRVENYYSPAASIFTYWEKNLNFSNLIFLITIIILFFFLSFAAAPIIIIKASQYYCKIKPTFCARKHNQANYYNHKVGQI